VNPVYLLTVGGRIFRDTKGFCKYLLFKPILILFLLKEKKYMPPLSFTTLYVNKNHVLHVCNFLYIFIKKRPFQRSYVCSEHLLEAIFFC
jgi:hypothetical protein